MGGFCFVKFLKFSWEGIYVKVWYFLFDGGMEVSVWYGFLWSMGGFHDRWFLFDYVFWFDMVSVKVWEVFMVGDEPTEEGGAGNRWEKLNQRWDGSERMDHCWVTLTYFDFDHYTYVGKLQNWVTWLSIKTS